MDYEWQNSTKGWTEVEMDYDTKRGKCLMCGVEVDLYRERKLGPVGIVMLAPIILLVKIYFVLARIAYWRPFGWHCSECGSEKVRR